MAKKTVRAGIVGAGFAARFHYACLRRVAGVDVEVAGVYAADEEMASSYAAERGVRQCGSLEELIDACEVLHVCTPPVTHEPIAVAALRAGRTAIVEKPFTGYFGEGEVDGERLDKQAALDGALASVQRMLDAEAASEGRICYAENWVYAPAVQKEREILEKTGGQILWMHGEESHSGSHSPTYGLWKYSGGGSLIGKGCHPLTAALYLKAVEGQCSGGGKAIRPAAVSARMHRLTGLDAYRDEGHLRTDYTDVEDWASCHVVFEDGTIADIFSAEVVMGGIHNWLEVVANNHRTHCNINPNTAMQTYNPVEASFRDVYVVEKIGTKQGWSCPSPDEDWFTGYPQELEAFYAAVAEGGAVASDSRLAADTISVIYSAYLSASRDGAEAPVRAF